jgi:uncharacterized protein (DUF433 family)
VDQFEHLCFRFDRESQQLWLDGRNVSVGQLVATMRANGLTPEEAAEDLDLPIDQIREALGYYGANYSLVDSELRRQRTWLLQRGYMVDPPQRHNCIHDVVA